MLDESAAQPDSELEGETMEGALIADVGKLQSTDEVASAIFSRDGRGVDSDYSRKDGREVDTRRIR